MKQEKEIIQRINSNYVSGVCAQVMIPYINGITILNKDGILYHHYKDSTFYINKYLDDERRILFPYNNIPAHHSKKMFGKVNYINQILNYDETYISVADQNIIERCIVKDGNSALSITKVLKPESNIHYLTREQLEKILYQKNNNEQIYYLKLDGSMYENNNFELLSEEKLRKHIENGLRKCLKDLREYSDNYAEDEVGANYLNNNKYFLDFAERSIDKLDVNEYNWDIELNGGKTLILIRIDGNDIKVEALDIKFINNDNYQVKLYKLPITKYTLEQLKYLTSKIKMTKEPKIPLSINPGITKNDIKEAKKLLKK